MTPAGYILWLVLHLNSQSQITGGNAETFCTALGVFTEARGEPWDGQVAVAQVIKNRERSSRTDACTVIFAPHQFSGVSMWHVGVLPWVVDRRAWLRSLAAARAVLAGKYIVAAARYARFFHAKSIKPKWAASRKRVAQIGNHIFYQ